jgi:signal peptidase II
MSRTTIPIFIVLLALTFDQILKIWIKTTMMLGEEINVIGNWFILHFTENNGMAFGMEFGGNTGKIILTLFRIIAIGGLIWYLVHLNKTKAPKGYVISISFILAGAIGNIIDSVFYGMIFNDSFNQVASMFPEGGGYTGVLRGKVVDMLYFPVLKGNFPDWFPFKASEPFIFFRPVFNIADSCVTIGVMLILLFQRKFFQSEEKDSKVEEIPENS